ncbi:uncharacterized protein LOC122162458 isoform X3 [Centrocercus urophasianus]|uniref:uncharacterized protein LOC122162458 isoform X3 n=1 Tax=Centrocercus urophasianus TaxID=9002 RepID=UPI001C64789E|nr:uncharacterized protein LOC122162458 isoform X3 [Centrocercus urophasianus]
MEERRAQSIFRGLLDTRISLLLQEVSDSWTAAGEDSEEVSQHAYPDPAHRSVLEDSGMDLWSHLVQFCSHNRTADGEDKCIFLYENTQMQTCWSTTTGAVYVCVEDKVFLSYSSAAAFQSAQED